MTVEVYSKSEIDALLSGLDLTSPPPAAASSLSTQPWIAYGQAQPVFGSAIDNPSANTNGLRGEATLPYTVPAGKELVITAYGLESYAQVANGLVLVPWIGTGTPNNSMCLHSVYSNDASNETTGVRFHVPAGKVVNVRIMSSENPSQVVGWYIAGELRDAP